MHCKKLPDGTILRFTAGKVPSERIVALLERTGYSQTDLARIVRVLTDMKTAPTHINAMIGKRIDVPETVACVVEAMYEVLDSGGALPLPVRGTDWTPGQCKTQDLEDAIAKRVVTSLTKELFSEKFRKTGLTRREFSEFATRYTGKKITDSAIANVVDLKSVPSPEMAKALLAVEESKRVLVVRESTGGKVVSRPVDETALVSKVSRKRAADSGHGDEALLATILKLRQSKMSLRAVGKRMKLSHEFVRRILERNNYGELTQRVRRQVILSDEIQLPAPPAQKRKASDKSAGSSRS